MTPAWRWTLSTNRRTGKPAGFVLVEVLMVVALLGLMTVVAMVSFSAMWGNLRFKRQADQLVNTLQMAYNAAAESDRHYAVVLDLAEQSYTLREFKTIDLETMHPDDAVIQTTVLSEAVEIYEVLYDDGDYVSVEELEDRTEIDARFLAGRSGWKFGGNVTLLDEDGMPWTIVIPRFGRPVGLYKGVVDIDPPLEATDVRF